MPQSFCTLLLCLLTFWCSAQTGFGYEKQDPELLKQYITFIKNSRKNYTVRDDYPYKSELKTLKKTNYEAERMMAENEMFDFNRSYHKYINEIKNKISYSNPQFDFNQVWPIVTRHTGVNAFSTGDGTIALYSGLIEECDNEAQLAFTMCHEFAHYFLDHQAKTLVKRLDNENSEEYKEKLEDISSSEYYQATRFNAFVKDLRYYLSRVSRIHEKEADSLGLILYLNAGYPFDESINLIDHLDDSNDPAADLLHFSIFDYFGLDSVKYDQTSSINMSTVYEPDLYIDRDSVLTHPDCPERIETLLKYKPSSEIIEEEYSSFGRLKALNTNIMVYNRLTLGWVDLGLVSLLTRLDSGEDNKFVHSSILYSIQILVSARHEHHLMQCAVKPYPNHQNNVQNDLSHLLYGTRFSTMSKAFYRKAKELYQKSEKNDICLYSLIKLADITKNESEKQTYIQMFYQKHNESDLLKEVRLLE